MLYILIIVMTGQSPNIATVEFNTMDACIYAGTQVAKHREFVAATVCVPKGEKQ